MKEILFPILAAGAGACIAVQATANSNTGLKLASPAWATFFSICGTMLTAIVAMLILRPAWPTSEMFQSTRWWNWIGGPLGVLFVLAGATLVKDLGAATYLALVVGGQLLGSLLLDHFAVMGLPESPLSWGKVIGALMVVSGVVCIKVL